MNAPDINRSILRMHIAAIEAKLPIKILGLLPRGSVGHVFEDNALEFLAEKRPPAPSRHLHATTLVGCRRGFWRKDTSRNTPRSLIWSSSAKL